MAMARLAAQRAQANPAAAMSTIPTKKKSDRSGRNRMAQRSSGIVPADGFGFERRFFEKFLFFKVGALWYFFVLKVLKPG